VLEVNSSKSFGLLLD